MSGWSQMMEDCVRLDVRKSRAVWMQIEASLWYRLSGLPRYLLGSICVLLIGTRRSIASHPRFQRHHQWKPFPDQVRPLSVPPVIIRAGEFKFEMPQELSHGDTQLSPCKPVRDQMSLVLPGIPPVHIGDLRFPCTRSQTVRERLTCALVVTRKFGIGRWPQPPLRDKLHGSSEIESRMCRCQHVDSHAGATGDELAINNLTIVGHRSGQ